MKFSFWKTMTIIVNKITTLVDTYRKTFVKYKKLICKQKKVLEILQNG